MKPSPQVSMQRSILSGGNSIFTPSAFSTSADPERDEIDLLPCLATGTPAPATTNAAQVEILNVPLASPPVPQVSMAPFGALTLIALARIARAAPAISSMVSPRTRMPISSDPIWASVPAPDIINAKASAASSCVSVSPDATLRMAPRRSSIAALPCTIGLEGTDGVSRFHAARAPVDPRKVEEIREQLMAVLRGDALGMELYPVNG